jgi:hypothetical protein
MTASLGSVFSPVSQLPINRIAHGDLPVVKHFAKRSAPPVRVHRGAEPGVSRLHLLTRLGLSQYPDPACTDSQDSAPGASQWDSADHQVRSPSRGRQIAADLPHQQVPGFPLDESDLPAPSLIGISHDPSSREQARARGWVHRTAVDSLDPDRFQGPGIHSDLTSAAPSGHSP